MEGKIENLIFTLSKLPAILIRDGSLDDLLNSYGFVCLEIEVGSLRC